PLSRSYITPSAQEEVDRAAFFVHGPVQVDPLAAHLDIRLIHTPGVADWPCVMIPALFKLRDILLHPPKNGRMSQQDTPLGHHLDQVTGTELESEVPSHTQNDDLLVKVPPLEQILCRGRFHHPGRYGCAPVFSSLHQNLADLVLGFLDALGVENAHLVGHSFGGAIAMTTAGRKRERIHSLTLISTCGLG